MFKLLEECVESQSTVTRTGVFYKHNGRIVLEYMKSTKNVWIDDEFAEKISESEKPEIERQIREFFHDRVKNVSFGLGLNANVDEFNEQLYDALKSCKTETERESINSIIKLFIK
jgi:hypothetical protein